MKKVTRILALTLALVMFSFALTACGGSEEAATTTAADVETTTAALASDAIADGVLTVGTNAEFPPFEYIGDDGNPDGFDIALLKEIGKVLNVEVQVENMEFKSLIGAMGTRIDVIAAGMTVTEERKDAVDFSDSYYTAEQYVLVKEGGMTLTALADFAGKKIGVQEGTTGDFIATGDDETPGLTEEANISRYKKAVDAVVDLQNGRLDAVIIDSNPAQVFADTYDGIVIVEGSWFDPEYYAIAMPKGDTVLGTAINEAIATLKANGKFDELVKTYIEN